MREHKGVRVQGHKGCKGVIGARGSRGESHLVKLSLPDFFSQMLQTAICTKNGRRFEYLGQYEKRAWRLNNEIFPNQKYYFNGRHFRVLTMYVSEGYLICIRKAKIMLCIKRNI